MSGRVFSDWLSTFRQSINGYEYYTDFKKVYQNAKKLKIEINILNSLIGSNKIEQDFTTLLEKYPECLKVIPILLAVRGYEIYCQDEVGALSYNFACPKQTIAQYTYFMRKTGLFDLFEHHIIANLYDYITGIEVGLDSNGRKNRGGHQMEKLVELYLLRLNVKYFKEMYLSEIETRWKIDLSKISAGGTSTKRLDFVVYTPNCIFLIETNFYASSGSKLNETARSYKLIAEEAKHINGIKFVWITDGAGWLSAKGNLKETFDVLDDLYNIADLANGALNKLFFPPAK